MATYKYRTVLTKNQDDRLDAVHESETISYRAGRYQCFDCGGETAVVDNTVFPPRWLHMHHSAWRSVVRANPW